VSETRLFLTALFLIFLVLKLCGIITWSWWLVTMPLWIGFALFVLVGGFFLTLWMMSE